jgi:cytochrome c biogenesis protein CcmG, thiol:disulfide interchange protein DsbE
MTAKQQWVVVIGIVVLLAAGLITGVRLFSDQLFPVTVGSRAPDFSAKDVHTQQMKSLADYKGQVVLLNIWATWCPPCLAEMPSIEELYKDYRPLGLKVVAVSIDDYVTEDSIRAFAKGLGLTFEILHDPTHAIERAYQTTGYPETFVVARDGTIRKKWISAADWNSAGNRALFTELLGASPRKRSVDDTIDARAHTVIPASMGGEPARLR